VTAFFASYLAHKHNDKALLYLDGINYANSLPGNKWHFHEYVTGNTFKPFGTRNLAWNAAAAIIAYECVINNKRLFL